MAIPDFQTLMLPVLRIAAEKEHSNREAVEIIVNQFSLSQEERERLMTSGHQPVIANRVFWAITYLFKACLIERPKRGRFIATKRGKNVLKENPEKIDIKFLLGFKEFVDFKTKSRSTENNNQEPDSPSISSLSETIDTPEEQINDAAQLLNSTLRDDILAKIIKSEPAFFEKLIIDLMIAMGYGATGSGQHLGKTNDGGIDGIINEDPLGLDVVFLQAKRYAPGNNIGVEKIREFAGSLDERGAVKGVFVTTSGFAQGARLYAERSPKRLILIDGETLTKLLIRYSVGVRTFRTIELKKIDLDYFNTEE
jgi:restriction system protein